jgi:hypothetical protein
LRLLEPLADGMLSVELALDVCAGEAAPCARNLAEWDRTEVLRLHRFSIVADRARRSSTVVMRRASPLLDKADIPSERQDLRFLNLRNNKPAPIATTTSIPAMAIRGRGSAFNKLSPAAIKATA